MHSIQKLKDLHYTETIYIICAGSSTTYFEPSFFADKIVIGVNNVFKKFPCSYVIAKDLLEHPRFTRMVEEIKEVGIPLIYPEHHTGHHKDPKNNIDYELGYMFEHLDNKSADMNDEVLSVIGTDKLVVSRSTITSAINLAAYMGAFNIVLVGHDCGTIDGVLYEPNYTESDWGSADNYASKHEWVATIESNTLEVKKKIKEVYNCNIYSLNPFINFGLEGHKYKASTR